MVACSLASLLTDYHWLKYVIGLSVAGAGAILMFLFSGYDIFNDSYTFGLNHASNSFGAMLPSWTLLSCLAVHCTRMATVMKDKDNNFSSQHLLVVTCLSCIQHALVVFVLTLPYWWSVPPATSQVGVSLSQLCGPTERGRFTFALTMAASVSLAMSTSIVMAIVNRVLVISSALPLGNTKPSDLRASGQHGQRAL